MERILLRCEAAAGSHLAVGSFFTGNRPSLSAQPLQYVLVALAGMSGKQSRSFFKKKSDNVCRNTCLDWNLLLIPSLLM